MTGVHDGAEEHYLRALDLFAAVGDIKSRANVLSNLADVMIELGRYSEASVYAERGARNFHEAGDRDAELSLLRRLAATIEAEGEDDISLSLYKKALRATTDLLGGDHPDAVVLAERVRRLSLISEAASNSFDAWSMGAVGRVLGSSDTRSGTCFRVGPRVWVTAATVLRVLGSDAVGSRVRLGPPLSGESLDATVERVDREHDLAVLVADNDAPGARRAGTRMPVLLSEFCAADQMPPGEAVRAIGPWGSDPLTLVAAEWAGQSGDGAIRVLAASAGLAWSGMAGAPVIRARDGAVAGVVLAASITPDGEFGLVRVARAEDVVAVLHGIADVTMDTGSGDSPDG